MGAPWEGLVPFLDTEAPTPAGHVPLYHLGNNPYHLWVVQRLRREPGLVVLHDTVMHHLLVEEAAAGGDWSRFATELEEAHPGAGARLAEARRWGYSGHLDAFVFPARQAYLRHARGVIVHSERARVQAAQANPSVPVRRVPLAVAALPAADREAWRARLGAGSDELVLTHLGFLTPAKGMGVILRALATLRELGVAFRLVVVGEGSESPEFAEVVAATGLHDDVLQWGWASGDDLGGIVAATDLGLVPRYPTAGETSAAALRFLASGTPVVVAGYEQFLELPVDAALRVPPGGAGVAELVRHVARLAGDAARRERGRAAARLAWEAGGHAPEVAAAALVAAVEEIAGELAS